MSRNKIGGLAVTAAAITGAYAFFVRPALLRWGAADDELDMPLPGDALVPEPRGESTRATTIDVPPKTVWPWLVQLGQGRGGLYSYDWLENMMGLEIHSANEILPEYQELKVGDVIRLIPEGTEPDLHFEVALIEPEQALVLRTSGTREAAYAAGMPYATWSFVLQPLSGRRSRLIVRFRTDFDPKSAGYVINKYALEPVHFLMEQKMMQGIKERAEGVSV